MMYLTSPSSSPPTLLPPRPRHSPSPPPASTLEHYRPLLSGNLTVFHLPHHRLPSPHQPPSSASQSTSTASALTSLYLMLSSIALSVALPPPLTLPIASATVSHLLRRSFPLTSSPAQRLPPLHSSPGDHHCPSPLCSSTSFNSCRFADTPRPPPYHPPLSLTSSSSPLYVQPASANPSATLLPCLPSNDIITTAFVLTSLSNYLWRPTSSTLSISTTPPPHSPTDPTTSVFLRHFHVLSFTRRPSPSTSSLPPPLSSPWPLLLPPI